MFLQSALRSFTGFCSEYIHLAIITKHLVQLPRAIYFMRDIPNFGISKNLSIIINSDIFRHIHVPFRHIQSYMAFRTLP